MIDFLKYRPLSFLVSFVLVSLFIGGIVYKRSIRGSAFIYSVDFTGGTQVLLGFSEPITGNQVLKTLETEGMVGATAREFSSHEVLVRVKAFENDAKGLAGRIHAALEKDLQGVKVSIKQTDSVGAGVGSELRTGSVQAVLVALLLMLAYIWYRFRSLSYALGGIVALMHDALVILTFVLWFDYEISLNIVSAVLFILGYSINDTIVIFSRIRESMAKKVRSQSIEEVVNISINETLRRTILTSVATCLVVIALLLFGGEVLKILSLALLIGMTFGTYSSIYIASPVMLLFHKK